MRDIIRKILLEHNGESTISLSEKELKFFSYLIDNDDDIGEDIFMSIGDIRRYFKKVELILTPDLIEKQFFLLLFNKPSDILNANIKKDTSELYLGPFYRSEITHYNKWREDQSYVIENCDYCSGTGEVYETCGACGGVGYEDDDEFLESACYNCGGNGEVYETCGDCGGSGEQTFLTKYFTIDEFSELLITKNDINEGDIEITWQETFKNILKKRDKYFLTLIIDPIDTVYTETNKLTEDEELIEDKVIETVSMIEELKPNVGFRNFLFKKILKINV